MKIDFEQPEFSFNFEFSKFSEQQIEASKQKITQALEQMKALEAGERVNTSEDRMVGHYWLRNAELAPTPEFKTAIQANINNILHFAQNASQYNDILLIGIGGSVLGPQFVCNALKIKNKKRIHFFDNTDPQGFEDTLADIPDLSKTITLVISKSGGTTETANGMEVAKYAYQEAGLNFAPNFVAITGEGSKLDKIAESENWSARFPVWDWVGGRTSISSSVGLLPFALLGYDIQSFLEGMAEMDQLCREVDPEKNPAMLLSLFIADQTKEQAEKNMVVLPYSDRLALFAKYLQQLIMESLGKETALDGSVVNQGITVLGNKGTSDQHSYVQQLREGPNDFFAIFVKVKDLSSKYDLKVNEGFLVSEYLDSFFRGTRAALFEKDRESLSIEVPDTSEKTLGALIALFEKMTGFYASFIGINAYDQPGVEAGKLLAKQYLQEN